MKSVAVVGQGFQFTQKKEKRTVFWNGCLKNESGLPILSWSVRSWIKPGDSPPLIGKEKSKKTDDWLPDQWRCMVISSSAYKPADRETTLDFAMTGRFETKDAIHIQTITATRIDTMAAIGDAAEGRGIVFDTRLKKDDDTRIELSGLQLVRVHYVREKSALVETEDLQKGWIDLSDLLATYPENVADVPPELSQAVTQAVYRKTGNAKSTLEMEILSYEPTSGEVVLFARPVFESDSSSATWLNFSVKSGTTGFRIDPPRSSFRAWP